MEKRKGNTVVGIIFIVLLVIAVVVAVYFAVVANKKDQEISSIKEDVAKMKDELEKKELEKEEKNSNTIVEEKNTTVSIDVDKQNEELSKKVLKIKSAGDSVGIYLAIMDMTANSDSYMKIDKFQKVDRNGVKYSITDTSYSTFTAKLKETFTDAGIDYLFSSFKYGGRNNILEINSKVAVAEYGWSGSGYSYKSQKLVSKNGNTYNYEVTYSRPNGFESTETTDCTMTVTGKVENNQYRIDSFKMD